MEKMEPLLSVNLKNPKQNEIMSEAIQNKIEIF